MADSNGCYVYSRKSQNGCIPCILWFWFPNYTKGVFAIVRKQWVKKSKVGPAQYFCTYYRTILFRFLVRWARGKLGLIGHYEYFNIWQGKIRQLRETALKRIFDCAKKHGQCVTINLEVVESFLHQIKNKMILVAIVGEGSCGKSTLINALLRDRYIAASKELI